MDHFFSTNPDVNNSSSEKYVPENNEGESKQAYTEVMCKGLLK